MRRSEDSVGTVVGKLSSRCGGMGRISFLEREEAGTVPGPRVDVSGN